MSRTPAAEQTINSENAEFAKEGQTSYQDTQKLLGEYGENVGTLERGGEVGADPYQTPAYLANQNKLTADVTSGENSAAKQNLEMQQRRSGGQNTGATQADITKLALGKMRLGNQLQTQQRAQDFQKNLQWQQYLAGAPLQGANTEAGLFGTATQGESSTASDMSKYALAQQQEWYKNIQQLLGAAGGAAGTAAEEEIPGVGGDIIGGALG